MFHVNVVLHSFPLPALFLWITNKGFELIIIEQSKWKQAKKKLNETDSGLSLPREETRKQQRNIFKRDIFSLYYMEKGDGRRRKYAMNHDSSSFNGGPAL